MRRGTAVEYDRYGGFDVVQVVPQERPAPGDDEVVVEVAAAGLNHVERFLREGALKDEIDLVFPAHQGVDFAGVVALKGKDVRDLRVGDEVVGHAPSGGAHANWVTVPRTALLKKAKTLGFEVAGGLYLAGCTALTVVRDLHLGPDDTVVITAAAGGVGHIECQLAKDAGARVIAVGSPRNHDYLRQIGTVPVAYGEGELERIQAAAEGRPITAFIQNHAGEEGRSLAEALGVPAARIATSSARRDIEVRLLRAPAADPDAMRAFADILAAVEQNRVRVLISGFYPFEYIVDAYEDLARMHSRGKVVVGMHAVERGARASWYRTEKSRDHNDPPAD